MNLTKHFMRSLVGISQIPQTQHVQNWISLLLILFLSFLLLFCFGYWHYDPPGDHIKNLGVILYSSLFFTHSFSLKQFMNSSSPPWPCCFHLTLSHTLSVSSYWVVSAWPATEVGWWEGVRYMQMVHVRGEVQRLKYGTRYEQLYWIQQWLKAIN